MGTGTLQEAGTEQAFAFYEDGTSDLRSSTEELYFLDEKEKMRTEPLPPQVIYIHYFLSLALSFRLDQ